MALLKTIYRSCSGTRCGLVTPLFAAMFTGCFVGPGALVGGYGEDHWGHYEGGGMFEGGTPAMSPNGSNVVYSSPCSGHGDIVRINRDGSGRINLTRSNDFEANPIYSPVGKKIAYVREHAGDRHIWLMNADGTGQRPLTSGRIMDDLVGFSTDGSKVLFDRSEHTGGGGRFPMPYAIGTDGKDLAPRIEGPGDAVKEGVVSSDGKLVYFASRPYARDLCVRDADGAKEHIIRAPAGYKTPPRLSPDGRTLMVGVYTNGRNVPDIVLIDVGTEGVIGQFPGDCDADRAPMRPNRSVP